MSEFLATTFAQSESELTSTQQQGESEKSCFRTDKSYVCKDACQLKRQCCRPVAEWLRYRQAS